MKTLAWSAYLEKLLSVPRPGADKVLAFYEHRVGAICTDPRLLLAPLDDHLCHRGDGVFESIAYRHRCILQLEAHVDRMQNSASGLHISPPCSWEQIKETVVAVAKAGGDDVGDIRVLVGRGPGGFGISPTECPEASLYIVALKASIPNAAWYEKGLTSFKSDIPAKQEYLARIKNTNYLPNVLMAEEARAKNMDVALSFDAQGCLAEAAVANVAIVDANNTFCCPPFTNTLPGTTLLAALEAAAEDMPTQQRAISEDELINAKELLLFSSAPLCVGITHYEGRPIGTGVPGPVARKLLASLEKNLLSQGTVF